VILNRFLLLQGSKKSEISLLRIRYTDFAMGFVNLKSDDIFAVQSFLACINLLMAKSDLERILIYVIFGHHLFIGYCYNSNGGNYCDANMYRYTDSG